jgi:prepilin-type processing-associated H-X9-DG protein
MYADDYDGVFVPAAADYNTTNLRRWHGVRDEMSDPFDPAKGPLMPYIGSGGQLKECPGFSGYSIGFEAGGGGYGYNNWFVGSLRWRNGPVWLSGDHSTNQRGGSWGDYAHPSATLAFTDCALPMTSGASEILVEYSFAELPYYAKQGADGTWQEPDPNNIFHPPAPSIHFRHRKAANVLWLDSHVTQKDFASTTAVNFFGAHNERFHVGWFKPKDFSLFDTR